MLTMFRHSEARPVASTWRQAARRGVRRALLPCALAAITGCATSRPSSPAHPSPGASTSEIRHIVLVDLKNPDDREALVRDMDRLLPPIDGVVRYWRGSPAPIDRPEVIADYDVGLVIDFSGPDAYERYVRDPRHVELVATWKPRANSLRIYDIAPQLVTD